MTKIILETQQHAPGQNQFRFFVKLTNRSDSEINLKNYRVVLFLNTLAVDLTLNSPTPEGSFIGNVDLDFRLNTNFYEIYSPKIHPTNEKFDSEYVIEFKDDCVIAANDSLALKDMTFRGGSASEIFVTEFENSYSYLQSNDYIFNPKTILEYNDPTYGWIKHEDFSYSNEDYSYKYPYDDNYENLKNDGNVNRINGINATFNHRAISPSIVTYIDEANPNTHYTSPNSFTLNGNTTNNPVARIGVLKFDLSAYTDITITDAILMIQWGSIGQCPAIDLKENLNDIDNSVTWNNFTVGGNVISSRPGFGSGDINKYPDTVYLFEGLTSVLNEYISGAKTNNGFNISFSTLTGFQGVNNPQIYLNDATKLEPKLIIYTEDLEPEETITTRTWKGEVSDDWFDGANWVEGKVPTSNSDVKFVSDYNNPCKIDNSIATAKTFIIQNGFNSNIEIISKLIYYGADLDFNYDFIDVSEGELEFTVSSIFRPSEGMFIGGLINHSSMSIMGSDVLNVSAINGLGDIDADGYILNIGFELKFSHSIKADKIYLSDNCVFNGDPGLLNITELHFIDNNTVIAGLYDCDIYHHQTSTDAEVNFHVEGGVSILGIFEIINENSFGTDLNLTLGVGSSGGSFSFDFNQDFDIGGSFETSEDIYFAGGFILNTNANEFTPNINLDFSGTSIWINDNFEFGSVIKTTSNYGDSIIFLANSNVKFAFKSGSSKLHFPSLHMYGETNFNESNNIDTNFIEWQNLYVNFEEPGNLNIRNQGFSVVGDIYLTLKNVTVGDLSFTTFIGNNISFVSTGAKKSLEGEYEWFANAETELIGKNLILKNSNASEGVTGHAINSTDDGGNINWDFPEGISLTWDSNTDLITKENITISFTMNDAVEINQNNISVLINGQTDYGQIKNIVTNEITNELTFDYEINTEVFEQHLVVVYTQTEDLEVITTEWVFDEPEKIFTIDRTSPTVTEDGRYTNSELMQCFEYTLSDNYKLNDDIYEHFTVSGLNENFIVFRQILSETSDTEIKIKVCITYAHDSEPNTTASPTFTFLDKVGNSTTKHYANVPFTTTRDEINISLTTNPENGIGTTNIQFTAVATVFGTTFKTPSVYYGRGLFSPVTVTQNTTDNLTTMTITGTVSKVWGGNQYLKLFVEDQLGRTASIDKLLNFVPVIIFETEEREGLFYDEQQKVYSSKTPITVHCKAYGNFMEYNPIDWDIPEFISLENFETVGVEEFTFDLILGNNDIELERFGKIEILARLDDGSQFIATTNDTYLFDNIAPYLYITSNPLNFSTTSHGIIKVECAITDYGAKVKKNAINVVSNKGNSIPIIFKSEQTTFKINDDGKYVSGFSFDLTRYNSGDYVIITVTDRLGTTTTEVISPIFDDDAETINTNHTLTFDNYNPEDKNITNDISGSAIGNLRFDGPALRSYTNGNFSEGTHYTIELFTEFGEKISNEFYSIKNLTVLNDRFLKFDLTDLKFSGNITVVFTLLPGKNQIKVEGICGRWTRICPFTRKIDLIRFLPDYLYDTDIEDIVKFFEDYLNTISDWGGCTISILELINRLSYLKNAWKMPQKYFSKFAQEKGLELDIGNGYVDFFIAAIFGSNDDGKSEIIEKRFRFLLDNLITINRIKSTRELIISIFYILGIEALPITLWTNDYETFVERPSAGSDSVGFYPTPHFKIAINTNNFALDITNSEDNEKWLEILTGFINKIKPVNTVFEGFEFKEFLELETIVGTVVSHYINIQ